MKNRLKMLLYSGLLLMVSLSAISCVSNYYLTAYQLQLRGNYVGAVENYDEFLARSGDGATKVRALNLRSAAYYEMGKDAMSRNNFRLAIRLFYLANSLHADAKMVDCYLVLAENAHKEGDVQTVLQIYDFVITNYQVLLVIPEVVFRRLSIYHRLMNDRTNVWINFRLLVDHYNDHEYIEKAVPLINEYMPGMIEEAIALKNSNSFKAAIEELLYLGRYPHHFKSEIVKEVGILYYELAESNRQESRFFQAHDNYLAAISYNLELEEQVNQRLNEMVVLMVRHGESLLQKREIAEAKRLFRQTFEIIPDNHLANEAVQKAEQLEENIRAGDELFRQALRLEQEQNYEEALRIFRQSYSRDRLQRTDDKIFLMTNLIEIEKDPVAFARTIITQYRDGIVQTNINNIVGRLRSVHGDDVRVSGWRIMLSTGANRYEVRYDVMSRSQNYFLIWQVNLLNRGIVPLNKESQEVMGG